MPVERCWRRLGAYLGAIVTVVAPPHVSLLVAAVLGVLVGVLGGLRWRSARAQTRRLAPVDDRAADADANAHAHAHAD